MVHHSFHRQEWFGDALQVPYILLHRIVLLQNIDKSKTLHIVLEEEVGTQKLYYSLVHRPTPLCNLAPSKVPWIPWKSSTNSWRHSCTCCNHEWPKYEHYTKVCKLL